MRTGSTGDALQRRGGRVSQGRGERPSSSRSSSGPRLRPLLMTCGAGAALLCAGAVVLLPGQALGQGASPRAALWSLEMGANLAPGARGELLTAAERGWSDPAVIGLGACRARAAGLPPAAAACSGARGCVGALGSALGVQAVAVGSVAEEMGTYTGSLQAFGAPGGALLVEATWGCEICTLREAVRTLEQETRTFRKRLFDALGPAAGVTLALATHPAGAQVRIDGVGRGLTPLELTLPPGQYLVGLHMDGFRATERLVELARDPVRLEFGLRPLGAPVASAGPTPPPPSPPATPTGPVVAVPTPPPALPPGPEAPPEAPEAPGEGDPATERTWLSPALGYTGLGLGLASTALGAVLIALDGEQTCDGPIEDCETLYDTGTTGIVFSVLGGALLAGSAVVFVLQDDSAPPVTVQAPSARPAWGVAATPLREGGWLVLGRVGF